MALNKNSRIRAVAVFVLAPLAVASAFLSFSWNTRLGGFQLPAFRGAPAKAAATQLRKSYASHQRLDLRGESLSRSQWHIATFQLSRLNDTDLRHAQFDGVYFFHVQAAKSAWEASRMQNVVFQNTNLRAADFRSANLSHCGFFESDLRAADFRGAMMSHCLIYASRLTDALFDDNSALPFSREEALARGMRYVANP